MKSDREIIRLIQAEMRIETEVESLIESSPAWVKTTMLLLVNKIRNTDSQIRQTNDVAKKIDLMAQQIKWSAYMTGILIAFDSNDKTLQSRLKTIR